MEETLGVWATERANHQNNVYRVALDGKRYSIKRTKRRSVDVAGFALHEIHQQVLAEVLRGGEVGFAAAHLGDFLNEVDQGIVGGQHEGVDHDVGAFALVDFLQSFTDHKWVEAEGVFVDAAVVESERGRLAVGDHDDLAHVLALAEQNALGHAQAFASVGVKRTDLHASEFVERNLFGGIVEENEMQRIDG